MQIATVVGGRPRPTLDPSADSHDSDSLTSRSSECDGHLELRVSIGRFAIIKGSTTVAKRTSALARQLLEASAELRELVGRGVLVDGGLPKRVSRTPSSRAGNWELVYAQQLGPLLFYTKRHLPHPSNQYLAAIGSTSCSGSTKKLAIDAPGAVVVFNDTRDDTSSEISIIVPLCRRSQGFDAKIDTLRTPSKTSCCAGDDHDLQRWWRALATAAPRALHIGAPAACACAACGSNETTPCAVSPLSTVPRPVVP